MSDPMSAVLAKGFCHHPKIAGLSCEAVGVWAKGLGWVKDKLSDGRLSAEAAKKLRLAPRGIEALVRVGLWEVAKDFDGWVYHDYLHWNDSRAIVLEKIEANRLRAAKNREAKRCSKDTDNTANASDADQTIAEAPPAQKLPESAPQLTPSATARAAMSSNVISIDAARSAESIGAQWYAALTTTSPDFTSWRKFYATIGSKPKDERDKVAEHARLTPYFAKRPSASSPEHFVTYWHDFLAGPRTMDRARPPLANTRASFKPGAPSSREDIALLAQENPEWAKAP